MRFWLAPQAPLPEFRRPRPPHFDPIPELAPSSAEAAAPGLVRELRGRVVDPAGAGVSDAIVYVRIAAPGEPLVGESTPFAVPLWTLTAADGAFRLDWPAEVAPARELDVLVAAWGFAPTSFHETVPGAEPAGLLLQLPAREPALTNLSAPRTAALFGRLQRERGARDARPLEYQIALVPIAPPDEFGAAVARRVECDPDGAFSVPELADGTYRLRVLPSWAAGGSWPDLCSPDQALVEHRGDPEAALEPVVVRLSEGALEGELDDDSGAPVEGALVLLTSGAEANHVWPPAASDANGHFSFEDLPPGRYALDVRAGEASVRGLACDVRAGERSAVSVPPLEVRRPR